MKNSIRILALLCSVLLCCSMAACGKTPSEETAENVQTAGTTQTAGPPQSTEPSDDAAPEDLDEELQRAYQAGLLPEDWMENMEQSITFAEYCAIVGTYVSTWDSDRLTEWEAKTGLAAASEDPMDTEDGFLLLSYLWIMMGYEAPQLPEGLKPWAEGDQALRDVQTESLSWDYPLFPDNDTLAYPEYQGNYIWGGVTVLPDVVSAVSGERVFPYEPAPILCI